MGPLGILPTDALKVELSSCEFQIRKLEHFFTKKFSTFFHKLCFKHSNLLEVRMQSFVVLLWSRKFTSNLSTRGS